MVVDGKHIGVVSHFIFLGSLITKDGFCEREIRKRLAMGVLTKIRKEIEELPSEQRVDL